MSDTDGRHLVNAAARAEADPFFVAFALAAYRALAGLHDTQLAAWLGCPLQNLPRLALCRRPDGESVMFGDEVQRIADYVDGDAGRLAHLLRAVENAEEMGGVVSSALMAAQDRQENESKVENHGTSDAGPPSVDRSPSEGSR